MSSSLGALVNNLPKDAFKNLLKYFTPKQAEILKQKGFYPYEYMDTEEKFNDTKLPPREAFYSKLSGRGIKEKDYNHAWNVWNTFKMKTFKEYHELYNITDVLLLADVFENFRDICLKMYGFLLFCLYIVRFIILLKLIYPDELHHKHNDYPFCPERVECKNGVEKLIPNLRDKTKYIIHYKNLIQCLKAGMKLKKIHRGIKFIESDWMKPYIEKNTNLRAKAKNNFEKDFYKLMNNSVFGKTMENIRNRVNVKLVNTEEKLRKLIAKPNFRSQKIFSENLVSVHMKKTSLTMNKPVYLGMCILDLSKTIMFDFHYNYIKPKYEDKAKLLFTDTDSLMYEIETEDFYKDISGDVKNRFDTSDYPENHPSGIPTGINKKVLGMFKDETAGKIIKEFVGLRAKLYSFKMDEGGESKKCKGVKKQVVESSISHEDYKTCLTTGKEQLRKQNILRSYDHEVYTEEVNKIALSAQDDKRYISSDGVHTLAWGHYKIKDL